MVPARFLHCDETAMFEVDFVHTITIYKQRCGGLSKS